MRVVFLKPEENNLHKLTILDVPRENNPHKLTILDVHLIRRP
jgi:hypothetical protein